MIRSVKFRSYSTCETLKRNKLDHNHFAFEEQITLIVKRKVCKFIDLFIFLALTNYCSGHM